MKSKSQWLLLNTAILLWSWAAVAGPVQATTPKPTYYPGERLEIVIAYTQLAVLTFSQLPQTTYLMDGTYDPVEGGIPVFSQVTAPYTWTNRHSWSRYNLLPGNHSVVGTVYNYGSGSTTLQVVP